MASAIQTPIDIAAPLFQPTQRAERIRSLDVLRGFALLGILIVNIQSFSMPDSAYTNPMSFGDFTGLNYVVWWITYVMFDSKMMALFSMLFGAGIVLMSERAIKKTGKVAGLHYRRMLWLLVIGLVHAYLIWYGDILVSYALCGMIVFWLRNLKPKWLILIAVVMLMVSSGFFLMTGFTVQAYPDEPSVIEMREELNRDWNPSQEQVEEMLATYRGSWLDQMKQRSITALGFQTFIFAIFTFWRAGGLMLIGMAMFKWGVFQAKRSNRFYVIGAVAGLLIGYSLVLLGVRRNLQSEFEGIQSLFINSQFNYWGSLFVCLGYACLVMLVCKSDWLGWLKRSLQAVGQMALTNYLMQSIVCTLLFYGHGLGSYGYLDRWEQLIVVVVIWIAQMVLSPIWLSKFRYGPFEWLWRSLAYWKLQPMS